MSTMDTDLQTAWEKVMALDQQLEKLKAKHQQALDEHQEYRSQVLKHVVVLTKVVCE